MICFSEGGSRWGRGLVPLVLAVVLSQPGGSIEALQDEKPAEGGVKKKKSPIPELAADQLPKRTRARPDPAKSQVELDAIHVTIVEMAQTMAGKRYTPQTRVVQNYLGEYLRRAGYRIVENPAKARYRVSGKISTIFDTELILRNKIIAWKYAGTITAKLQDANGKVLQEIDIPEVFRLNVKSEKSAIWDLRRFLAHIIYSEICLKGDELTNGRIVKLIESLAVDSFDQVEDIEASAVVEKLAGHGLEAVPYLLQALTDTRTVMVKAAYPGLKVPTDLKIYHLADKTLEEIFQKVSRMELKTPPQLRFYIIAGWENEWRRFCKPFRESPEADRRKHALLKKSAGAVQEKNLRVLDFSLYGKKPGKGKVGEPKEADKEPSEDKAEPKKQP